jgi:hypothetical protein
VSGRFLPDDEVDRLLREALADDLPREFEDELRQEARAAWRRAASEPRRARWRDWLGVPAASRHLLPQPALVAAALAMLAAGAVMQAAPAPRAVVASLEGRQAGARTTIALERAQAMRCTVDVEDGHGHTRGYRVEWEAPGLVHVHFDGAAGVEERSLRIAGAGLSVLTRAIPLEESLDPQLEPARAYLTPSALGARLAGAGLAVTIDPATHLPLRLEGTDRDGRKQAAVCRWP